MLLPIDVLTRALRREYAGLLPLLTDAGTQASGGVAAANAIDLLACRAERGAQGLADQARALRDAASRVAGSLAESEGRHALTALAGDAGAIAASNLEAGEAALRGAMARFEAIVAREAARGAFASGEAAVALADWEAAVLLADLPPAETTLADPYAITGESLAAYLRDRFAEPGMAVTAFRPLPGGFGKETTLFSVAGAALSGDFVMRRDPGDNQSLTNDCHEVAREYPVIRAAFDRGFPAPDALWLDTDHPLLPGGHFIVMRKSPGELGGSFFGATTQVAPELGDALAEIAARLHTLEPLTELGDLASFIKPDLWSLSRGEAARRYIAGWRDYYLAESHTPSPALLAIYGWLLENVPDRAEPASLVHGDVGFNNFLFDEGKLSAVLDWEFAHIGDPAEELGYIAVTTGAALDWPRFMAHYVEAGGDPVDAQTLHYFKVWAYARNASAANILWTRFSDGLIGDLKVAILPYHHYPHFIRGAAGLIAQGPQVAG
ncbi:MAG: phosphotransferase [Sphingomonadales bacterium]|nr:phosphotransferase [Sphingomonadales bacterium]